uniref:Uncharacterized protein n=1 Tax=Glossina austeni TaxID=7395 RepID=A0A1A9VC43_GLOAU
MYFSWLEGPEVPANISTDGLIPQVSIKNYDDDDDDNDDDHLQNGRWRYIYTLEISHTVARHHLTVLRLLQRELCGVQTTITLHKVRVIVGLPQCYFSPQCRVLSCSLSFLYARAPASLHRRDV